MFPSSDCLIVSRIRFWMWILLNLCRPFLCSQSSVYLIAIKSSTFSNKKSLRFEKPLIAHSDIMMFSLSIIMKAFKIGLQWEHQCPYCLMYSSQKRLFGVTAGSLLLAATLQNSVKEATEDQLHPALQPSVTNRGVEEGFPGFSTSSIRTDRALRRLSPNEVHGSSSLHSLGCCSFRSSCSEILIWAIK